MRCITFWAATLLCLLGLVGGCQTPASEVMSSEAASTSKTVAPLSPDSIFTRYLHNSFRIRVPQEREHWYVVIPAVGCLGCAHAELRYLAGTSWAPNVTVIASGLLRDLTAPERRQLAQHTHLLADTMSLGQNTLDRVNLPFTTLTGVVHTQQGRATEFIPFDNDSYQKVFARLPRRQP